MNAYVREQRLLTVENLSLAFKGKSVLRNINLHVDNITRPNIKQGQVIALLGPSGIGKTQLFKCLSGLQKPTSGTVKLNNSDHEVEAGEVGVVFQNYPLFAHRTVKSNLQLAARSKNKDAFMDYVNRCELADKLDLYPAQLSGGQRQRVAIIQQLLCSTYFVIADEPFSGLDFRMKKEICKLFTELSLIDTLNTFIITTHDIETAIKLADTIWVLGFEKEHGRAIAGATVIKELDLIERGLAWNSGIADHPNFIPTVREIEALFLE